MLLASVAVAEADRPDFECTDAEQNVFRIWTNPRKNSLEVVSTKGKRVIALSGANMGRLSVSTADPMAYNGWNPSRQEIMDRLDFSTEVTIHYVDGNAGGGRIRISLVLEHRERLGLQCRSSGFLAEFLTAESDVPAAQRYATLFSQAATWRDKQGELTSAGLGGVEAAVLRMFYSADYARAEAQDVFVKAVSPALKAIAEISVKKVDERFRGAGAPLWKKVRAEGGYDMAPKTARFVTWIQEGSRVPPQRNLDSVHAGLKSFRQSSLYKETSVKNFFAKEVIPSLRELSRTDIDYIKIGLDAEGYFLLLNLWSRANLVDYPDAELAANEVSALFNAAELDPVQIHRKIVAFQQSSMAKRKEVRALYVGTLSYHIRRLTPRQREDIGAWFQGDQRAFFIEIAKGN